jgi:hypothetical protein
MFHGINALQRFLDLAHLRELLAHLEVDFEGLRKFLGSVICFREIHEHLWFIRFNFVLVALVASRLQVRGRLDKIYPAKIIPADGDVEKRKLFSFSCLDRGSGFFFRLRAFGPQPAAGEQDFREKIGVHRLFSQEFVPDAHSIGNATFLVKVGALPNADAVFLLLGHLRCRDEGGSHFGGLLEGTEERIGLYKVKLRRVFHLRISRCFCQVVDARLTVECRHISE